MIYNIYVFIPPIPVIQKVVLLYMVLCNLLFSLKHILKVTPHQRLKIVLIIGRVLSREWQNLAYSLEAFL